MCPRFVLSLVIVLFSAPSAFAFEPVLLKESVGADANVGTPCTLNGNTNGNAANLRWYNVCSGYIWIYNEWAPGEAVGVRFGGPWQAFNEPGDCDAIVKRAITYYRNVAPGYNQTVDVSLHVDFFHDGCPDSLLAADLNLDPGLRWNCSNFNQPFFASGLIVRQAHHGGFAPAFATDGPFTEACNPNPTSDRSFYYGVNGEACVPWIGPTGRTDNFLTWLILDDEGYRIEDFCGFACCLPDGSCFSTGDGCWCVCWQAGGVVVPSCAACGTTPTQSQSWGRIKGLFR